jgi:hypothetical protein
VFRSSRSTAVPVRSIQNVIATLIRLARLATSEVSAPQLRHAFALSWLPQHLGRLVELAQPLGHESLDNTAVYTRASAADLARGVEQTQFNLNGSPTECGAGLGQSRRAPARLDVHQRRPPSRSAAPAAVVARASRILCGRCRTGCRRSSAELGHATV